MASILIAGHRVSTSDNKVAQRSICYLKDLIKKHFIYNGKKVLLKDNELIAKYGLTEGMYYGMIRKLIAIGVISEVVYVGNSISKKASLYSLNVDILAKKYGVTLYPKSVYRILKIQKKRKQQSKQS